MCTRMRTRVLGGLVVLLPLLAGGAQSQDTTETQRLKAEIAALRGELTLYQDQLDAELTALRDSARLSQAGTNRFVITGYGFTRLTSTQNGPSVFVTEIAPILLWQLSERVLFQSEVEFEMGEELETAVEYAHVSYLANDFLSLGAGKFLTPFNIFNQRLHAAWINKLPTKPMAFAHGGLVPATGVGAYARGGFPVGSARASYAVYGINAPVLMTMGDEAGEIEGVDESEERAFGGRIGLLLLRPGVEVGLSYQTSDAAKLQGVDVSVARQITPLRGTVDLRVEHAISNASEGPFMDEDPTMPDRFLIDNKREGGYGQFAYRPTLAASRGLRNLELVGRYEWMVRPEWTDGVIGNDTKRYTAGVSYWLAPSMQFKMAYQRANNTMSSSTKSLVFQVATGF